MLGCGKCEQQYQLINDQWLGKKESMCRNLITFFRSSVLGQFECQPSQPSVEAGLRLLRNISAEALPKTDRFGLLAELSAELQREHFHDVDQIRARERDILTRWNNFLTQLSQREAELGRLRELSTLLGELDELGEELAQLGQELGQRAQETGKHLAAVDELLSRHELAESNVRVAGNLSFPSSVKFAIFSPLSPSRSEPNRSGWPSWANVPVTT
jgi:hypothetical protein